MGNKGFIIKWILGVSFIIWIAFICSTFYITQDPQVFQVTRGIASTLWAITLTMLLLTISAGLGNWILRAWRLQSNASERLLLGTGVGMGILGFTGYWLGAAGWAKWMTLGLILFGLLVAIAITKVYRNIWEDLKTFAEDLRQSTSKAPALILPWVAGIAVLTFLFTFLPPAEAFDALLYHLALPEKLLADGGLVPYNNFPFWYPSLVEGNFLWGLALGSEQTAQMIHWAFAVLTGLLLWSWTRTLFADTTAWWTLAILISMPSLPWVASWAYTDMVLTFESLAALYAVWRWRETNDKGWLLVSGVFAGLAMGIKYTSFVLPIVCVVLIFVWENTFSRRLRSSLQFSLVVLFTALPWYLRNWLVMGNPVYPLVFGGRYWDSFRTAWLSGTGTGIGWDIVELMMLPLSITLGHRDQNFFDGRIGPLFLLLLPLALWAIWTKRTAPRAERTALTLVSVFFGLSYFFWTFGVIQTERLWQSRYLWPGLIAFTIPIGLGVSHLKDLDLPRLRISFVTTMIIRLVIAVTLINNALYLIVRMPLVYTLGLDLRQSYFERMQPDYAAALELVNSTPSDSYVYFLCEPRSYNMARNVQPDPINDNLMHDYYLFGTPEAILSDWQSKGYTHILIYDAGLEFMQMATGQPFAQRLEPLLEHLEPEAELRDYRLYSIPDG